MGKNVQSLLTLVVAIVVWSTPPAFAEKRVALVIGNGAYKNAVHLPNPRNDAQDVAASLTRIGFETIVGVDLDEAGMDEHAIQFARRARDADVARPARLRRPAACGASRTFAAVAHRTVLTWKGRSSGCFERISAAIPEMCGAA